MASPIYNNKPVIKADLSGKTVMVVGANTGIGYEAAKHFAAMQPSKVIITARNDDKAAVTVSGKCIRQLVSYISNRRSLVPGLKNETGFQSIEGRILELSRFASVVEFADKFNKDGDDLDILVINAGVAYEKFSKTQDGWEETYVP